MLSSRSIKKIANEIFVGDQPLTLTRDKYTDFLINYKNELLQRNDVRKSRYYYEDPEQAIHKNRHFRFHFSGDDYKIHIAKNQVFIEVNYHSYTIDTKEQVTTFLEKVHKAYQKAELQAQKREKIKNLKKQAITAKIKVLAKEERFDFYIKEYQTKLKLIIKLNRGKHVEIDIPYGKFQGVLKDLQSFIHTIQLLDDSGIIFRVKQGDYHWTKHEDL